MCDSGWTGVKCEKPCMSGMFGLGCTQNCSCFGNIQCSPQTGMVCFFSKVKFFCLTTKFSESVTVLPVILDSDVSAPVLQTNGANHVNKTVCVRTTPPAIPSMVSIILTNFQFCVKNLRFLGSCNCSAGYTGKDCRYL